MQPNGLLSMGRVRLPEWFHHLQHLHQRRPLPLLPRPGRRRVNSGGELHRQPDLRRPAFGGELHGQFHEHPDLLVVELRGLQHEHRGEPEPHLSSTAGRLHRRRRRPPTPYGQNTNTKNNYISIGNPPVANFSGTPTTGNARSAVTFTDSSTNSPTAWSWNFGDSNTSNVQNPSHTYGSTGTYTVALRRTTPTATTPTRKTNYIWRTRAATRRWRTSPARRPAALCRWRSTFTDASTNTPTAWSWTFGDSNTSTVQNPSHTYSRRGPIRWR